MKTYHDQYEEIRKRRQIRGFCTCGICVEQEMEADDTAELLGIKDKLLSKD